MDSEAITSTDPPALRDKTGSHGRLPPFTQKHVLKVVTVYNVKSTLAFKVMVKANFKVRVALKATEMLLHSVLGKYRETGATPTFCYAWS